MEINELKQIVGENELRYTKEREELEDRISKLEVEMKRIDIAISGLVTTTRENTEWLAKCDGAIKNFRAEQAIKSLEMKTSKVKSFFDKLIGR